MNLFIWCITSAVLFFIVIHRGESINCYTCTASRNSSNSCAQNVSTAVNCSQQGNYSLCMTGITNDTVLRHCANLNDCQSGLGYLSCYLCSSDNCNNENVPTSQPGGGGAQPGVGGVHPGSGGIQPGSGGVQPGTALKPVGSKPGAGNINEAQLLTALICICFCIVHIKFY